METPARSAEKALTHIDLDLLLSEEVQRLVEDAMRSSSRIPMDPNSQVDATLGRIAEHLLRPMHLGD